MKRSSLDENWKLNKVDSEQIYDIEVVPCQVHDVLLKEGVIVNPNIRGINQEQWIGESDWIYRKTFKITNMKEEYHLIFEGLDTFADIYLNGTKIGESKNVYIPYQILEINNLKEENELLLHFKAPEKIINEIELPMQYGDRVPHFCKARVFRSGYHDFSGPLPNLIRMGIYGHVILELVEEAGFREVDIEVSVDDSLTCGKIQMGLKYYGESGQAFLQAAVKDEFGHTVSYVRTKATEMLELTAREIKLWWPRSHGKAVLYELELILMAGDRVMDVMKRSIGFRKIDKKGDFEFEINGQPLRLWGANFVHPDTLTGCYQKDKVHELLKLAELAHFNCLRVWGEGEILEDDFYEECDKRGILLWHDFYLGYNMYSEEEEMLQMCRQEAIYLVKRLKHHASILLWCGGNEMLLSRDYQYPGEYCFGEKLFKELFADICKRYDANRYYHASSPSEGEYANDPSAGDTHGYTHLWYVPNAAYPVFLSENCRVSTPPLRSMERMMEPEELWPREYRQQNTKEYQLCWPVTWSRHNSNDGAVKTGPIEHYYDADTPEALIYKLQAAHAEYIKHDIERFRRGRADYEAEGIRKTRGHLLWKFNNNSNIISYGIVDYFNEPGMAYYALRRAYEPLQVSFSIADRIAVWLVNDKAEAFRGYIKVALFQLSKNKVINELTFPVQTEADESVLTGYLDQFGQIKRDCILVAYVYDMNGSLKGRNLDYLDIECHLKFSRKVQLDAKVVNGELVIKTDQYARCVELIGNHDNDSFGWMFEDNYFDILPGEEKRVQLLGRHKEGKICVKPYYAENEKWIYL